MNLEKQIIMLSALVENRDLMALASSIIKPSFFDPTLKKPVQFLVDYFDKFHDVPKPAVVTAETGVTLLDIGTISATDQKYVAEELEQFCRNRAVTEAILKGPALLEKEDFGTIVDVLKDAISTGLAKDFGLNYFDDPYSRLNKTLIDEQKIPTGWDTLDLAIGGGINYEELMLFAANSGVGKSMTMLNLGLNLLERGMNGVYISLEMSESVVSKRLDSMISGIRSEQLKFNIDKIAQTIEKQSPKMGKFIIKRFPENRTNVNHIRSYLQQLEQSTGFKPQFIIIDYIDIMGTSHGVHSDNMFIKDKFVTEEVRALGFDFKCIMISASQLGRSAIEADKLSQAHIQGGISKINTADYVIGLKQDDAMKAAGEINFELLKSRNSNGVGKRLLMKWNPISLRIESPKPTDELIKKSESVTVESLKQKKPSILDLIQN